MEAKAKGHCAWCCGEGGRLCVGVGLGLGGGESELEGQDDDVRRLR